MGHNEQQGGGKGTRDELHVTAYHEAAHAVVSLRVSGFADDRVSIVRRPEDGVLGGAVDGSSKSADPAQMKARALSCYAGGHAQRRLGPSCGTEGCEGDDEEAALQLRRFGWESREQELRERSLVLVQQHWTAIAAVAEELLRVKELDGTEVQIIADAAAGDPDTELERDLTMYRALRNGRLKSKPSSTQK